MLLPLVVALRLIALLALNQGQMAHQELISLVQEQMVVEQMFQDRIGLTLVEMPERQALLPRPREHGDSLLLPLLVA
jgi:hypothetical protein